MPADRGLPAVIAVMGAQVNKIQSGLPAVIAVMGAQVNKIQSGLPAVIAVVGGPSQRNPFPAYKRGTGFLILVNCKRNLHCLKIKNPYHAKRDKDFFEVSGGFEPP